MSRKHFPYDALTVFSQKRFPLMTDIILPLLGFQMLNAIGLLSWWLKPRWTISSAGFTAGSSMFHNTVRCFFIDVCLCLPNCSTAKAPTTRCSIFQLYPDFYRSFKHSGSMFKPPCSKNLWTQAERSPAYGQCKKIRCHGSWISSWHCTWHMIQHLLK